MHRHDAEDAYAAGTAADVVAAWHLPGWHRLDLPPRRRLDAVVSPNGNRLYVANIDSTDMSVVSTSSGNTTDTIPVGSSPNSIVHHPNGTRVYVGRSPDGFISVIDTATKTVINNIPQQPRPWSLAINSSGTKLYSVCDTAGKVRSVLRMPPSMSPMSSMGPYP